ncbi:CocE/NonD family hydrolase, partial [Streptomyces carpinensis]
AGQKVPVILSIGPYFGHTGQTGPEGWSHTGPSSRFQDFIEGTDLFDHGYAFVMVDLRGFGGSTGCLDWGGPGEQADVKAAIDWAAQQPWSTGAVGMYGKSY